MRRCPRGHRRSVDGGVHRPAIEPRKYPHPGCRRGFRGSGGRAPCGADRAPGVERRTRREAGAEGLHFGRWRRRWHVRDPDRQMAGRHVTTTASKRGEALVRSLGADEVIDYTSDDLSRFGKDFDAGFDLIGGEILDRMFKIMKPGTRIVSVEDWRWSGLFAASGLTRI